jgi:pimeloyl-ACP methyl ester carboxylesterase
LATAGDQDECDPSLSRELHEKTPGSELVILPNSGQMNVVDQPDPWHNSVRSFLSNK